MPSFFQNDLDGTPRRVVRVEQKDTDGVTTRLLAQIWQNDNNGVPKLIFAAFDGAAGVTVAPGTVYGRVNSRTSPRVTTTAATGTINSGTPPFSLNWQIDDPNWDALQPASATTAFRSPPLPPTDSQVTTARLVVTDSNGLVATSNTITLSASNDGFA